MHSLEIFIRLNIREKDKKGDSSTFTLDPNLKTFFYQLYILFKALDNQDKEDFANNLDVKVKKDEFKNNNNQLGIIWNSNQYMNSKSVFSTFLRKNLTLYEKLNYGDVLATDHEALIQFNENAIKFGHVKTGLSRPSTPINDKDYGDLLMFQRYTENEKDQFKNKINQFQFIDDANLNLSHYESVKLALNNYQNNVSGAGENSPETGRSEETKDFVELKDNVKRQELDDLFNFNIPYPEENSLNQEIINNELIEKINNLTKSVSKLAYNSASLDDESKSISRLKLIIKKVGITLDQNVVKDLKSADKKVYSLLKLRELQEKIDKKLDSLNRLLPDVEITNLVVAEFDELNNILNSIKDFKNEEVIQSNLKKVYNLYEGLKNKFLDSISSSTDQQNLNSIERKRQEFSDLKNDEVQDVIKEIYAEYHKKLDELLDDRGPVRQLFGDEEDFEGEVGTIKTASLETTDISKIYEIGDDNEDAVESVVKKVVSSLPYNENNSEWLNQKKNFLQEQITNSNGGVDSIGIPRSSSSKTK